MPRSIPVLLLLLCVGSVPGALAQKWVRGVVTDAETGATLAAATIQVAGTTRGTITNAEGRFELFVPALPGALVVRHIGYETRRVPVDADTPERLDVAMKPVSYALEEVVVSGEDPAVGIMRKVIAEKKVWRAALASTYAEVYTRFMLYRDRDLVQMKETINAAYWRPEGGPREVVRARRTRPEGSGVFRFAAPTHVPNFYDDDIEVLGARLIGPTHPDALEAYTFTLAGKRRQDDLVIYDIYFSPRKALQPAFVGRLAVLDSVFAVLEVGMRPDPNLPLPPPIIDADVYYEQQFAEFDGYRLPLDLRVRGNVRFGRAGVSYPRAHFEQVSRLTLHAVNVPTPDSLFEGSRRLYVHPLADRQDYLFRWNPGLIPLTPREIEGVVRLDRRMSLSRAFRPSGMLRGYLALDVVEPEPGREASSRRRSLVEETLANAWVWYNRVDGWHVGLKPVWRLGPSRRLTSGLAYDFDRKRVAAEVALRQEWGRRDPSSALPRRGFFEAGASSGTATRFPSLVHTRAGAGLATYTGFDDYFDYYRRDRLFARVGVHLDRLRTTLSAGVNVEEHRSVSRSTDWKGWLFGDGQRDNPAIDEGALRSLALRLAVGEKRGGPLAPVLPAFSVEVEHAPAGFPGADFHFTTIRTMLDVRFLTFLRRRAWPNALRVRVVAGASRGDLPLQRYGALDAAIGPYAGFGAFRTRRDRPYEGTSYAGVFWEHDFASAPFEILGMQGLAERGLGLAVFGAHGRTWIGADRLLRLPFEPSYEDRLQHELGLSLTNLFRLPLRLDLSHPIGRPGFFFTVGLFERE